MSQEENEEKKAEVVEEKKAEVVEEKKAEVVEEKKTEVVEEKKTEVVEEIKAEVVEEKKTEVANKNNVIPLRSKYKYTYEENKKVPSQAELNSQKANIIETAKTLINDYEKFTLLDYSNLKVTVDQYAKNLLEHNKYLESYKATHSKLLIDEGIKTRFLADMGKATEQDCSLYILDFIEVIETIPS